MLPTVVAPAVGRSLIGVVGLAAGVAAVGAAIAPTRIEMDTRATFYAEAPTRLIQARPYAALGLVVVVVALVALAVRRNRWQIGAATALLVPPGAALLSEGRIPGEYGYHYVLVVAFLEVAVLVVVAVLFRLDKEFVVTRRREDT